jgi:hypothetical protein
VTSPASHQVEGTTPARESFRLSRSADEGPGSPYLLTLIARAYRPVRLGEPVIRPQNLSPAFVPRPIARGKIVISSNSLSCPLRPYRRSPPCEGGAPQCVRCGNKKAAFCSGFEIPCKPSDGLEPSTPPYHGGFALSICAADSLLWSAFDRKLKSSVARQFLPQIALNLPEKPRTCPQNLSPRLGNSGSATAAVATGARL